MAYSTKTYNGLLRADPTRTSKISERLIREFTKRFNMLIDLSTRAIVDRDCFGLLEENSRHVSAAAEAHLTLPPRRAFAFTLVQQKVDAFMEWLKEQERLLLLDIHHDDVTGRTYVQSYYVKQLAAAYMQGMQRGRDELIAHGYPVLPYSEIPGGVAAAFLRPVPTERAQAIYARAYDALKGITADMDELISHRLAMGIIQGLNPVTIAYQIANDGFKTVGLNRAVTLARTEVIRAHHSATIQEYREAEAMGVTIMAEFLTAGDSRVCELCAALASGGSV